MLGMIVSFSEALPAHAVSSLISEVEVCSAIRSVDTVDGHPEASQTLGFVLRGVPIDLAVEIITSCADAEPYGPACFLLVSVEENGKIVDNTLVSANSTEMRSTGIA